MVYALKMQKCTRKPRDTEPSLRTAGGARPLPFPLIWCLNYLATHTPYWEGLFQWFVIVFSLPD